RDLLVPAGLRRDAIDGDAVRVGPHDLNPVRDRERRVGRAAEVDVATFLTLAATTQHRMHTGQPVRMVRWIRVKSAPTSILSAAAIVIGCMSLLGLGWSYAPVELSPVAAAVWSGPAIALAAIDLVAFARTADRRFLALTALAIACIALAAALVVL